MPRVYKNGVVRNVSKLDADKLKSEKNYVDADNKKIKAELKGKNIEKKQASKPAE